MALGYVPPADEKDPTKLARGIRNLHENAVGGPTTATDGNVALYDSSGGNPQRLLKDSGISLSSQSANTVLAGPASGAAAAPTFRALVGADGGSLVLLATASPSGASTVDFTSGITSTYDQYEIRFSEVLSSSAADTLNVRISQDGGGTWKAGVTDYMFARTYGASDSTGGTVGSAGDSSIKIATVIPNGSSRAINGMIRFFRPASTGMVKFFRAEQVMIGNDGLLYQFSSGGAYVTDANAINGVRIYMTTGTISGFLQLYAIRKS